VGAVGMPLWRESAAQVQGRQFESTIRDRAPGQIHGQFLRRRAVAPASTTTPMESWNSQE
jgi:hypothetical protein